MGFLSDVCKSKKDDQYPGTLRRSGGNYSSSLELKAPAFQQAQKLEVILY